MNDPTIPFISEPKPLKLPAPTAKDIAIRVLVYALGFAFSIGCLWIAIKLVSMAGAAVFQ